jgi:hypothetical protein
VTARVLGLAVLVACGGGNPARTAIDRQAEAPPAAGWTCAMHPQVHADGPGPCPICGMPLVPAK